jgi:hypothetical protein
MHGTGTTTGNLDRCFIGALAALFRLAGVDPQQRPARAPAKDHREYGNNSYQPDPTNVALQEEEQAEERNANNDAQGLVDGVTDIAFHKASF